MNSDNNCVVKNDVELIVNFKSSDIVLNDDDSYSGYDSEEDVKNNAIGDCLYQKIENEERRINNLYNNFVKKEDSENDTLSLIHSNYHSYICEWLKEMKISYDSAIMYNQLWWNKSEHSSNIFSCYHTKKDITEENPYEELYKKINFHVITTNSQTHATSKLMLQPKPFLQQCNAIELDGVLGQWVQRPYVNIICQEYQARDILKINDNYLCVGYLSTLNKEWHFNKLCKKYYNLDDSICVTKVFFPSVYRVINTTGIFWGKKEFEESEINSSISYNNIDIFKDDEELAILFVFYNEWNCDHHSDPTKYMLEELIKKLNYGSLSDVGYDVIDSFADCDNFDKIVMSKDCNVGQALYYKIENDIKFIDDECFPLVNEDNYSSSDNFGDTYYDHYYQNIWDFVEYLNLTFDDVIEYNKLWWKKSGCSNNIFSCPFGKYGMFESNPYPELYQKLNSHVIVKDSQMHLKDEINTDHSRFLSVKDKIEVKCYDNLAIYNVQRPCVELTCTEEQAEKLIGINDGYLCVGYLSFTYKEWYFNETCAKYCIPTKAIPTSKILLPSIYQEISTEFVFDGKSENDENRIDERFYNSRSNILISKNLVDLFVVYKDWDCTNHLDPTKYMFEKLVETLNIQ